jgi:hypothetical protein
MTEPSDRGANLPMPAFEGSMIEEVKYLRRRQAFMEAAVCFLMGLPPTGQDVTWKDVENLKAIIDFGREQVEARTSRKLRRARRWSQLVRMSLSMAGGLAVWALKDWAAPALQLIRSLWPFGWIGVEK